MTQPNVPETNGYEEVAAELRRIADALDTVPAGFDPTYASVSIQPGQNNQTASIAAVDAVALAVLGEPGKTTKMSSGTYHHQAKGPFRPVNVTIHQRVPGPDEVAAELERLRARVAELEASAVGLDYSRADDDPQVIRPHSPRVPLHTGAVVDGGALVPVSEAL